MFNSSRPDVPEKRRLARNPFKPPTPIKRQSSNQGTLNFFVNKSSSSIGLAPIERKKKIPLEPTRAAELNRSNSDMSFSSTPNFASLQRSTSSLTSISKSGSFQQEDDDDVIIVKSQPVNFKNSKPFGSIIVERHPVPQPFPRPSSSGSSSNSVTSSSGEPNSSISSSTTVKPFKPTVTLGRLGGKSSNGQSTLSFGGKDPAAKKRVNPWESQPLTKKIKNPRIKEESPKISNTLKYSNTTLQLSDEQRKVLDLVVNRKMSVFYTGSAGTGKSVLLRELVNSLSNMYGAGAVAVTASTGLAAVNIGGVTINRFSGFGLGQGKKDDLFHKVRKSPEARERWKRTKVLIIDEISMLDGRFLDNLEYVARMIRGMQLPFGGIQVVLTGDFFQLPPVDKKTPGKTSLSPIFCFESECWKKCITKTILLKKVFRQADGEFVSLLNSVRVADVDDQIADQFKRLSRDVVYPDGIQPTELFSTRYEVDSSNSRRLASLPGKKRTFVADDIAPENLKYLLDNTMAPKVLELKEDAQVMNLKNVDETLVNGSVGKVLSFLSKSVYDRFKSKHREYQVSDERFIKEMRMLSRCYDQTAVPKEVIDFAQNITGKEEFLEIAKLIITDTETPLPVVKFTCGNESRVVVVERSEFKVGESNSNKEVMERIQIPLLLSWALSIHKSQGQTLDRVKVDLTRVFEAGQVYVALSRAVSKERLQVINFDKSKINTNKKVKEFYDALESL